MRTFAADENFSGKILNGLLRRLPDLDVIRIQDCVMYGAPDDVMLDWVFEQGRILLTHDAKTIPDFFFERVGRGQIASGIVLVKEQMDIGQAIDELEYVVVAGDDDDFQNNVIRIPL